MWMHFVYKQLSLSLSLYVQSQHKKNEKTLLRLLQGQLLNERARSLRREGNGRWVEMSVAGEQRPCTMDLLSHVTPRPLLGEAQAQPPLA